MDFKAYSEEITRMVRPQSFPIGVKFIKPESRANAQTTPPLRFTRPFFKIRAPDLPEILPSATNEPYNAV